MRNHRKSHAFVKLRAALQDAVAHRRGERVLTVREVELPPPPTRMRAAEVVAVRKKLRVSQVVFARLLNVSPRSVQAWERNARIPSDAALRLLHIAGRHPEILLEQARPAR
jgi:putative transcriptional regulator